MLIFLFQNNQDVSLYESSFYRIKGGISMVQPFLITTHEENPEFYIRAHGHTIHVGPSVLLAMSRLLKYYQIYDLQYDVDILNVYQLLEFIFGINDNLVSTMIEFVAKIESMRP